MLALPILQAIAVLVSQPTDPASPQAFALSPALPVATNAWSFALALEPARKLSAETEDGVEQDIETRGRMTLGIARANKLDTDLTWGFQAESTTIGGAKSDDASGGEYSSKYAAVKFAHTLSQGIVIGIVLHGTRYDVDQLRLGEGVTSDTHGYVLGAGAGLLIGDKPSKAFHLYYLPDQRGTADAEGETRILKHGGLFGLDVTLPWSDRTILGASAKVSPSRTDEEAGTDPGFGEPSALGTPTSQLAAGWQAKWGQTAFTRGSFTREGYERADPPMATRWRLAVGTLNEGVESSVTVSTRWGHDAEEKASGGKVKDAPFADTTYAGVLSLKI